MRKPGDSGDRQRLDATLRGYRAPRAAIADSPEQSDFTSTQERLLAYQYEHTDTDQEALKEDAPPSVDQPGTDQPAGVALSP